MTGPWRQRVGSRDGASPSPFEFWWVPPPREWRRIRLTYESCGAKTLIVSSGDVNFSDYRFSGQNTNLIDHWSPLNLLAPLPRCFFDYFYFLIYFFKCYFIFLSNNSIGNACYAGLHWMGPFSRFGHARKSYLFGQLSSSPRLFRLHFFQG